MVASTFTLMAPMVNSILTSDVINNVVFHVLQVDVAAAAMRLNSLWPNLQYSHGLFIKIKRRLLMSSKS